MIQRFSKTLLLLILCSLRTQAFSQDKDGSSGRIRNQLVSVSRSSSIALKSSEIENGDNVMSDRRKFLANTMGKVATMAGITAIPSQVLAQPASASPEPNKYGIPSNKRVGGLANKIRNICNAMDEMQRDLMQERWDLMAEYPAQLRSYVPMLTAYTDSAFPSEAPSDWGLRVALRYEVGRFFGCLERLKGAVAKRNLDDAYVAYSDMSLHLDRYLRVGGIYTFYDDVIDNEKYFTDFDDATLVYANPVKDPAGVRDLVVLCKGPDKGRTGIVIGVYQDGSETCAVKLDRYKGMREIRVVPRTWAAKRLGEQDPDDVFLIPRKAT